MSDTQPSPEALKLRRELQPLSDRVYAAIEFGVEEARVFFAQDGRTPDPWLFSHLVRYGALHRLPRAAEIEQEIEDVSLKRNPMCGIELTHRNKVIRIFKKPNSEKIFLQPPGESPSRQNFYVQPQRRLPQTDYLFVDQSHLVYVWDAGSGGVELYLVKPRGFEDIWKPAECEWSIAVEHPATRVEIHTAFDELEDEELDIELDETGSEDDDPNAGA